LEFNQRHPPLLSLAQNIGLPFGAMFWGFGCDIFGRRWASNLTIGITAIFGLGSAGSPNFAVIGCLQRCGQLGSVVTFLWTRPSFSSFFPEPISIC